MGQPDAAGFSQEWADDDGELPYILESAEFDLLRLYALPLPAKPEKPA